MLLFRKVPILIVFSLLLMNSHSCINKKVDQQNETSKNDTIYHRDHESSNELTIIRNESISKCSSWLTVEKSEEKGFIIKGPIENIMQNLLLTTNKQLKCRFLEKETYFEIYYRNTIDTTKVAREEIMESVLDKLDLTLKKTYDTVDVYELVVRDSSLLSTHKTKDDGKKTSTTISSKYYDLPETTIENLTSSLNGFIYDYFIITKIQDNSLYKIKFKRHRDNLKKIREELLKDYGLGFIEKEEEIPFYVIEG
ncbi:MAG: hypothetical protein ACOCPM_07555 [Bacteroidales bacterium]